MEGEPWPGCGGRDAGSGRLDSCWRVGTPPIIFMGWNERMKVRYVTMILQ